MKLYTAAALPSAALSWALSVGALPNANHIFNSVHSAMRQWGSSLHHNGMSFYLVTVPAGTQLYHGSAESEVADGMDWVAFEPEHALGFARPLPDGSGEIGNEAHRETTYQSVLPPWSSIPQIPLAYIDDATLIKGSSGADADGFGYLHTYRTRNDLQFLYLDGQSAAKSNKGTLDTQDLLLLNESLPDRDRGKRLCAVLKLELDSQLAGVLRMEHGFEALACSFATSLQHISSHAVKVAKYERPDREALDMALLRSIATRFHGIGGLRVRVRWASLVTAYTWPLPAPGGHGPLQLQWPANNSEHRLLHWPPAMRAELRRELIHSMRHAIQSPAAEAVDWQSIADMIVGRYALWLRSLLAPRFRQRPEALLQQLRLEMRPFVDDRARNITLEAQRCSRQFVPVSGEEQTSLAAQAVSYIAFRVCETVAHALHDLERALDDRSNDCEESAAEEVVAHLRLLMDYLQWTTWKLCHGCTDDEVCTVAIWPHGNQQNHDEPSCLNASQYSRTGDSYW